MCASLLGQTVVGLNLCDLKAAVDVLASLDFVDAAKIVCVGLSLGGRMSMFLSAVDKRIHTTVASGCMNLYQERYQALKQCGSQMVPGLLLYGDTPEVFSLIAPRRLVIEIGRADPLIPSDWAERGLRRIERAYSAAGQGDRLIVDRFAGDHRFHGAAAFRLLEDLAEPAD